MALFAYAGSASALTLGLATPPGGGPTVQPCTNAPSPLIGQGTDDPHLPYHIPPGGGVITQWQTNTSDDGSGAAGASLTFVVLAPTGSNNWLIVGADSETLPNPLPVDGIASYTLASPITAAGGDTLGLYSTNSAVVCAFNGAATPVKGKVTPFTDLFLPPAAGQGVTAQSQTPAGWAMNEEVTLVQTGDAAVTTGAGPTGAGAGQPAVLFSTITNNGPAISPITFTDTVPSGLTVDSATVGDGSCTVSGQMVNCTTGSLELGQSEPVDVVVTPAAATSYTNTVSVANGSATEDPPVTDPNPANNTASATLSVAVPPPPPPPPPPAPSPPPTAQPPAAAVLHCVVPPLKGIRASLAKAILEELNCKVVIAHRHSKAVHKGLVVKSTPGKGTYADEKTIKLVVSSGRRA